MQLVLQQCFWGIEVCIAAKYLVRREQEHLSRIMAAYAMPNVKSMDHPESFACKRASGESKCSG